MTATIAAARVTIWLHGSQSLKDKRRVIRSLTERVRNTFNVSIAEIEDLDDLSVATLAIVAVSNSPTHADQMVKGVIDFIERKVELGALGEIETELIPY